MLTLAAMLLAAAPQPASLDVQIHGQRNHRGLLHLCLTRDPTHFPDCSRDPAAVKRSVPAATAALQLGGLPPGRYALTIIHDENGNRKLDTALGIPREGFGFSRNPRIRFGAPRFTQVSIDLLPGLARTDVRMQYII